MSQRYLTDAENEELRKLTEAIDDALKARTEWLNAKMVETSDLKIGDDIYDCSTGIRLGKVTKLYRYWQGQGNQLLDTGPHCHYEYETETQLCDNTSRQTGRSFGTKEEAKSVIEMRLKRLGINNPAVKTF
jgi:hypothetical protein